MRSESHPNPDEIVEFAEREEPEVLKTVTEQANELSARYEARQADLQSRIGELQEKIRAHSLGIDEVISQKELLADALAVFETGLLGKLVNFLKITEIKNEIGVHEARLEVIQKEFDEVVELLNKIEEELRDRTELEEIDQLMDRFYADQKEKLTAFEQDKAMRDVGRVSREHHAVFAHAFNFKRRAKPGSISVLQDEVDWKQKLNIVLGLSPELPTSSVREGKPKEDLYYGMGVLLKGGSIRSAAARDDGTMVGGGKRVGNNKDRLSVEKIDRVIDHDSDYNEIVVAEPQIAGFFIDRNRHSDMSAAERAEFTADLKAKAEELQMPIYLRMEDGKFYHAVHETRYHYGQRFTEFFPGEPISVEQILDNDFQVSDEQKRVAREAIFEDCPFKLDLPERYAVEAWKYAQGAYDALQKTIAAGRPASSYSEEGGIIWLKYGNCTTSLPVTDEASYLTGMQEIIERDKQELLELAEGEPRYKSIKSDIEGRLPKKVFHLLGFGESARVAGDTEVYEQARSLAAKYLPLDKCEEVLGRRLGPDGKFKITEADLKHISTAG